PFITSAQEPDKNSAQNKCTGDGLCLNVPIGNVGVVSGFEEYLQLWYSFVVGVVGILATVIIMWGGFKWLTSRGNAAAIGDAKDRIWSAVIGLVLVFLSYNLLWIINPKLVEIKLPTLNKGNSTVINTDNNLDNDKDVMSQLAQWSYDTASILPPGLEEAYIGMETSIEWLVRQNDQEALKQYLASHNINIVDSTGLLQANTQDLVGISRMGNTFGEMNVEYLNGGFILDANQANIINGLMDRDGVANGENGNNFTTNVIDAGGYQITRITDLNFDYADNRGNIYNYEISATGNRNNDGRWELRFQQ
ncbi:MAG: pilin, partial [Patescibacteria group bacterium]